MPGTGSDQHSNDDGGSGGLTGGGSGGGGTLGTPSTDTVEDVAGGTQEGMVVSGGGVADTSADDED